MMEKKEGLVLITGSSGLIGSRLARLLIDDYNVVGLDPAPNVFPLKDMETIDFDLTKEGSINAAFDRIEKEYGSTITSVIHLAAYYDFNGKDSPLYDEVTVKGTQKLLKSIKSRFEVEQFFFSSTNLLYKPCDPGEIINEDGEVDPNWAYPESKVETEKVIRKERGSIRTVIGRMAGVYDEWGHSIPLSHQIQRIYERKITGHLYSGSKEKGNPFIHLEDLVLAIKKIVDTRKSLSDYEILNISEGTTYSYAALQDRIGELIHGKDWATIEVPKPIAKAGAAVQDAVGDPFIKPWMIDRADDHYQLDISKAKQKIQWEPRHDLMEGLADMIRNLKENPEKWYKENNLEMPKEVKQES